jgi:5'-3' exonuclease
MSETQFDLIIVDGMNVLWRAAHAMRALGYEDANGYQETGAVYGFLDQVLSVASRHKFADVLIAWEGSRAGRQKIDPEYKAHRDEPDEQKMIMLDSIRQQRRILCGVLSYTKWGQIVARGWEADDAIATAAHAGSRAGLDVLIVSNDSDLLQCLRKPDAKVGRVCQWRSGKKENNPLWTAARLVEEHGVVPSQWAEVKALGGDTSDGYKGARGIGEKFASRIIAEHGTLANVVTFAATGGAKGNTITESKAKAINEAGAYLGVCLELAITRHDVRTRTQWGNPDSTRLVEVFGGLRFHSLSTNNTIRRMT